MSLAAAVATDELLRRSRRYCARLTRRQAKNFYYGLRLLPEPKRSAMFALYAYMRLVDDIADREDNRTVAQRPLELESWRSLTHAALSGENLDGEHDAIWPAFADMTRRFKLRSHIFDSVIAGQQRDLTPETFDTFEQLHEYCYQVAGVVGLASIHIWGFEGGAETEQLAVARGVALQLTNILRDLREDAQRGRIYLPREDLNAIGVTPDALRSGRGCCDRGHVVKTIVIGGGLAGMAAAVALDSAGEDVTLLEARKTLGGRAGSFEDPQTGEELDNCQHVLLGCCTNLIDFYRRIGVLDQIRWFDQYLFVEPGGRQSTLKASSLPPPFHLALSFLRSSALTSRDKAAIARAMMAIV